MGCPDPALLEDLPLEVLEGWEQYEKQVGLRDDLHWGMLLALLANLHRGKNQPAKEVTEFMPYLEKEITAEEISAIVKSGLSKIRKLNNK